MAEVKITLTAEDNTRSAFSAVQAAAQTAFSGIENAASSVASKVSSAFQAIQENWLAVGGVVGSMMWLKDMAEEAYNSEIAFNKLKNQVEGMGVVYSSVSPQIEQAIQATSQYAIVQGKDVANALQQLVFHSGNLNESMKYLNLTYDLAYQQGISVSEATSLVGRAMTGNVEMLGRYIPELRHLHDTLGKNATEAEKSAYAFALLKEKSADAMLHMTEHEKTVRELTVVWHDFREYIGGAVIGALDELVKGFLYFRLGVLEDAAAVTWLTDKLGITSHMYEGMNSEIEKARQGLQEFTRKTNDETSAVKEAGEAHGKISDQLRQETKARSDAVEDTKKYLEILGKYSEVVKSIGADALKFSEMDFTKNMKLPGEQISEMEKSVTETQKMVSEAAKLAGVVKVDGVWQENEKAMSQYYKLQNKYLSETNSLHEKEYQSLDALKTYLEGYGNVIDQVYSKQIQSQTDVKTEMESLVSQQKDMYDKQAAAMTENEKRQSQDIMNSWKEKIGAQSVAIIETEKSQAEARLGMWQKYYDDVKSLHTKAIDEEMKKTQELLNLEKQITDEAQSYATKLESLQNIAYGAKPKTKLQGYYDTQNQLDLQYSSAFQLFGQDKIDALTKYIDAAYSAVGNYGGSANKQNTANIALEQVKAAQQAILEEENKLKQAKQDEIDKTQAWANTSNSAMTDAQIMMNTYKIQVTDLGDQMSALKLSVDNSGALSAIADVKAQIDAIPDVTYKKIVYQVYGKGSGKLDGVTQSVMQSEQAVTEQHEAQPRNLSSQTSALKLSVDTSGAIAAIREVQMLMQAISINVLELSVDNSGALAAIADVKAQIDAIPDVTYKKIVYQVYGEGSAIKPISEKIADIKTMFGSLSDLNPSVTANFSPVTSDILTIMDRIASLGIQAGQMEQYGTSYYQENRFVQDDWAKTVEDSMNASMDMYSGLLSSMTKSLQSGADGMQQSMGQYASSTSQFSTSTSQFQDSVQQMQIDQMITVMDRIASLGIQAGEMQRYGTLYVQENRFVQDDWAKSISDSMKSSQDMYAMLLSILMNQYLSGSSVKIGGSFASGTPYVEKDMIAQLHQGEAVIPEKFNIFKDNSFGDVAGSRGSKSYQISMGDIQIIARDTDNIEDLARKIVKPVRDELRKLENIS